MNAICNAEERFEKNIGTEAEATSRKSEYDPWTDFTAKANHTVVGGGNLSMIAG
jgi:hypothetical protein